MNLALLIKGALEKRAAALSAMEGIASTAEQEGRLFNDEEKKGFEARRDEIKALDDQIGSWRELEHAQATSAQPVVSDDGEARGVQSSGLPSPIIRIKKEKIKGAFFAKYAHCLFRAGGNAMLAAQYAEQDMGDKELGAMIRTAQNPATSTAAGWAAELLQQEARDFIELLRPLSVYANFPAGSTFTFDSTNNIRIPRQTTGTPGAFVGEGKAIPVAQGAFDSITIQPYKLGVITVATNEVLARSTPALETILRDSMLRDTATVLDRKFISNAAAVAGIAPAGLFHASKSAAPLTPSATGTAVDDCLNDLTALMNAHFNANSPLTAGYWLMHPSTLVKIMNLRNAVGAFYFRDEINAGKLLTYPYITSTVVDISGNGGGASAKNDIALIDTSMLVKGQGMAPNISMSDSASVHMESAPVEDVSVGTPVRSLWQTQSVGLRLSYEVDYNMRHLQSVQWIDAIAW